VNNKRPLAKDILMYIMYFQCSHVHQLNVLSSMDSLARNVGERKNWVQASLFNPITFGISAHRSVSHVYIVFLVFG